MGRSFIITIILSSFFLTPVLAEEVVERKRKGVNKMLFSQDSFVTGIQLVDERVFGLNTLRAQALEDGQIVQERITQIGVDLYQQESGARSFAVRTGFSELSSDAQAGLELNFSW